MSHHRPPTAYHHLPPRARRPAARVRVAGVRVQAAAAAAKKGDFVTVHYTGSLDDGSTFDSSRGRDPLEFIVGAGGVIAGFDRAVSGLEVGGTRTVRLDPAEAYGERSDEARIQVPASQAPKGLVTGTRVGLSNGASAVVVAIDESSVTLDLNHELAGQSLTFEVEIVSICPSERMRTAVFAQGCFWGPQLRFQRLPGVIATEVAYCNGSNAFPKVTYEQVCNGDTGYAEALQVVYDSAAVSYEELLDVFFATHDPTQKDRQGNDVGTQYRSGIFLVTPDQREARAVPACAR